MLITEDEYIVNVSDYNWQLQKILIKNYVNFQEQFVTYQYIIICPKNVKM